MSGRSASDRLFRRIAPQCCALVAAHDVFVGLETVALGVLHAVGEERKFARVRKDGAGGAELAPLPFHCPRLKKFPVSHDVASARAVPGREKHVK